MLFTSTGKINLNHSLHRKKGGIPSLVTYSNSCKLLLYLRTENMSNFQPHAAATEFTLLPLFLKSDKKYLGN